MWAVWVNKKFQKPSVERTFSKSLEAFKVLQADFCALCNDSGLHLQSETYQINSRNRTINDNFPVYPDIVRIYKAMEKIWMKRQHAEIMMMEVVEKTNPELQHIEQNKELVKIGGVEALKSVALLHRQLGHPNGAKLVEAIKERELPFSYVQVARKYRCPTCIAKSQPKAVKVATLYKPPHFNHTLSVDTFHLQWKGEKKKILRMMDEFSRYELDCHIEEETAAMEIALMESTWMRSFGYPKRFRTDASGPHQGEEFAEWTSRHGMQLELIPRGAHHRLGILERNHAIRRKQLEMLLVEEPEITLGCSVAGDFSPAKPSEHGSWFISCCDCVWIRPKSRWQC